MILHHILQPIFLISGIIALSASITDKDWFFKSENTSFVVKHLGRKKSRWLYGALGVIFIVAAVAFYYKIKEIG